jgi:hypothetical protein
MYIKTWYSYVWSIDSTQERLAPAHEPHLDVYTAPNLNSGSETQKLNIFGPALEVLILLIAAPSQFRVASHPVEQSIGMIFLKDQEVA